MTRNHRRIIRYLELKGGLAGPLFLVPEDIEAVKAWPAPIAGYVWRRLKDHIFIIGKHGITAWTCPFCIRHVFTDSGCSGCEWGEHHGRCGTAASDVYRLNNVNKFTNDFYRSIFAEAGK